MGKEQAVIGYTIKADLDYLMQAIGERGHHVLIRYDPLRTEDHFTIIIDNQRIIDTDSPKLELNNWWEVHYPRSVFVRF